MKHLVLVFIVCISVLFTNSVSAQKNTAEDLEQVSDQTLYLQAMENFNNGYYGLAGKEFEEIENKFVFSPLATKSIIMSMYSYYKAKKYDDSLRLIQYYKKINFDSDYLEYISYMEILNKYNKIMRSKKDLVLMNELYIDIENILNSYSNSIYRDDILTKKNVVINNIIKNELLIYKFYIDNNNLIGAINHLKVILNNFPQSDYTAEILYRLLILYKHINYKDGINDCQNILKNNYNNTKWYKYANK